MMQPVKRLAVYLSVLVVLVISVSAGWVAVNWPNWCRRLQWCGENFPHSH